MLSFMKNSMRSILQRLSQPYFIFCCFMCLLVTLLPWWPTNELLIIPKYALLFGPRWWLLVCVISLFVFWRYLSKRQLQFCSFLILLSLNYLDFQLPSVASYFSTPTPNSASTSTSISSEISILSANIGGGGSKNELDSIGFSMEPDIILLQEARRIGVSKLFNDYDFKECISGLCIVSKYPFKQVKVLSRKLFQGWGIFAVFYEVETQFGMVSLANVHFETPRSVLMGLIYRTFDFSLATTIESNRQFEAELVSLWSQNKSHTLIAGDFNMPEDENTYQRNFTHLNNAIGTKGFGFNATKHTVWHGVRIDHVLYSDDFTLKTVDVIESINGDHRPVIATFSVGN
jgi:endonuclease/exonuclease/phosphatase family metal-dependent hydrolase